jgi:hypothetical protein
LCMLDVVIHVGYDSFVDFTHDSIIQ